MIKLDDRKTLFTALGISLFCLLGGLYYMLSQWEFYEPGQDILAIAYFIACFVLFFALRFTSVKQIIITAFILVMLLIYADKKFEWRRDYIQNANQNASFILEPYIDAYPTFEEHSFGWLWGAPSWVKFADECISPSLRGTEVGRYCRAAATIQHEYNIDPLALVNQHFARMKRTAQRIESGDMKSKKQYQTCLNNKTCALIPLLPANVDPESIDRQSNSHIVTRKMFWSLINDKTISPEICEFMDLCRALRDMNVMPLPRP